ncbi:uncharacterized protein STEHIDRAFT_158077 [Stereum hirsutum FP-91666 SS1]|uniref:uncharacterized protein n=1 Tax=Stereum hirsutum (strain FP-91666) TaxID=721885 RepID=UPI0004449B81|nr:uncharacterized protein STEHIDRAFT_158077 [Stereum hirsutum FP-91666 SS1]EIM85445.1 hypothetical protein STEHIDRAFT_158077 [Stereum hirsutum FP-91666 SS1]
MNSNSAGSKVSIPADFKPLVDIHLSPTLQLAITPRPETIPDKSKAGKAFRYLREAKLGLLWDSMVNAFYDNEGLIEFEFFVIKFLLKSAHPHLISNRIQSTCPVSQCIIFKEISDMSAFKSQFRS